MATLTQTPPTAALNRLNNNNSWSDPIQNKPNLALNSLNSINRPDSLKTTLSLYNAIFSDDDDDDTSPPHILGNYYPTAKLKHPISSSSSSSGSVNKHPINSPNTLRPTNSPAAAASTAIDNGTTKSSIYSSRYNAAAESSFLTASSYHVHQADNALKTLKRIILEDDWKKVLKHKSGVMVHMKNGMDKDDKTPIFKGEAVIQGFSPQSIFYVVGMRKLWDEQYEDGSLVENLTDTISLTYEAMKPTPTQKSRDSVLVEKIECTQNGAIIFACTSVETPRIPKVNGRTRANIKLQGWILEPLYGGPRPATKVIYVVQEAMKGWVPGFAKKTLARRPLVIAKVAEYLEKKTNRLRSQQQQQNQQVKSGSTFFQTFTGGRRRRPSIMSSSNSNSCSRPKAPPLSSPLLPAFPSSQSNGSTGFLSQSSPSLSALKPAPSQRSRNGSLLLQQQQLPQQPSYNINDNAVNTTAAYYAGDKKNVSFAQNIIAYPLKNEPHECHDEITNSNRNNTLFAATESIAEDQSNTIHNKLTKAQLEKSTGGLYSSHRHPIQKVESLQLLKRLSLTTNDWSLEKESEEGCKHYIFNAHISSSEEEDDLTSLLHEYNGSTINGNTPSRSTRRLSFIRVDGVIEGKWTAEQLCSVVCNFEARKIWDFSFENARRMDRFSQKDYLEQWILKHANTAVSLPSMDMAVITSLETDPVTGTVYAASTSVDDPQLPPPFNFRNTIQNCIRTETDLYGWVFRPLSKKKQQRHGDDNAVSSIHVSFICNMNFNYNFSNQVLQAWINASYRSISQLKHYLDHYGCPPYIRRVAGKVIKEEFDPFKKRCQIKYIAKHQPSDSYRQRKERRQQQQKPNHNNKSASAATASWCTDVRFDRQMYPTGVDICITPASATHIQVSTKGQTSVKIFTIDESIEGEEVTFSMLPLVSEPVSASNGNVPLHTRYAINGTLFPQTKRMANATVAATTATEVFSNHGLRREHINGSPTPSAAVSDNDNSSALNPSSKAITVLDLTSVNKKSLNDDKGKSSTSYRKKYKNDSFLEQGRRVKQYKERDSIRKETHTGPNSEHSSKDPGFVNIPKGYVLVSEHQNNNIISITDELSFNGQQLSFIFLVMVLCYYMGKFSSCSAS
ncbi:hypothetical protein BDF20DRAFT_908634 [Mycotypha africana]|uniref:uncharacterized protein n=1 Tax=Mycotypha africana TaxID=64632 RepID=UPI002301F836|nr:uncharacterized protein BDF20DRAFT_908634 [Mycotypha africana]KAI8990784.1 hypothetical protein BDF20DRAFT_908634 [Mycotypha africana]